MNLYQKINNIKKAVKPVAKDVTVGFGKAAYSAVSHDGVLNAVNDLMIENGVISYVSNISDDTERSTWSEAYNGQNKAKFKTFTKVKMVVTFINSENPEEKIEVFTIGHADDPSDKAAGKAYSYAVKYAYLKLFGLQTGINDEERHNYGTSQQLPKPQFNQQAPMQQYPQQGYPQR